MVWRPPQLPPVQRPVPPKAEHKPSLLARLLVGIGGVVFAVSAAVGLWRALQDTTGRASPFASLAMLLPAMLFLRYAVTGKLKL